MSAFAGPFETLAVGDELRSDGRTVTEGDVTSFAALTWDVHPLHTDEEYAAATPFGGRIAHGMLVLSYAMGLVGPQLDRRQVLAVRKVTDATFRRPVHLGDTIRLLARVAKLTPLDDDAGLVAFKGRVVTQRGEVAMTCGLELLWRRAAAEAAA